jgi:hypothetical protein
MAIKPANVSLSPGTREEPEVGARRRDPRAVRQRSTIPHAVVARVVDDAAVGRRLAHRAAAECLDPVGDPAPTTHRIDDEISENRTIVGPNTRHARHITWRPFEPGDLDSRSHVDSWLPKDRSAQGPLDERATDTEDPERFVLGSKGTAELRPQVDIVGAGLR